MIDDPTLDAVLSRSRPNVEHDATCTVCARPVAAPPRARWVRRTAIGGLTTGIVLAVGTAAAATVGLPFVGPGHPVRHTQTVSNGDQCRESYVVVADPQRPSPRALTVAQQTLGDLEIESLDISDEIAYIEHEHAHSTWMGPGPRPDFLYLRDSRDAIEAQALFKAVHDEIAAALRSHGLADEGYSLTGNWTCDDSDRAIDGD